MGVETIMAADGTLDPEAALRFLRSGSKIPGDCGNPPNVKPEWVDMKKCLRARKFFEEHYYSVMTSHSVGVFLMAQVPSLVRPLMFTGKSDSRANSCRRWADTIHHVVAWYTGDIWDTTDYAHKSVMIIKGRHKKVSDNMNSKEPSHEPRIPAVPNPESEGDLWLSQYDMALTLFTFLAALIVKPERLSLTPDMEEDFDALIHLWRCVGYLLGMQDKYNIFGYGGFRDIQPLCCLIIKDVSIFHWNRPVEEFSNMLTVASDSLRYMTYLSSQEAWVNFAFDIAGEPQKMPMDWYARLCLSVREGLLYLMRYPMSRHAVNSLMRSKTVAMTKKYMTMGSQCPVAKYDQDGFLWGLYQTIKKMIF